MMDDLSSAEQALSMDMAPPQPVIGVQQPAFWDPSAPDCAFAPIAGVDVATLGFPLAVAA